VGLQARRVVVSLQHHNGGLLDHGFQCIPEHPLETIEVVPEFFLHLLKKSFLITTSQRKMTDVTHIAHCCTPVHEAVLDGTKKQHPGSTAHGHGTRVSPLFTPRRIRCTLGACSVHVYTYLLILTRPVLDPTDCWSNCNFSKSRAFIWIFQITPHRNKIDICKAQIICQKSVMRWRESPHLQIQSHSAQCAR
jgi:hypothetical protein